MAEHRLTVPAEFAEDFRAAIVREIAFDIRQIEDDRKARLEDRAGGMPRLHAAKADEDAQSHLGQLADDMALAQQVDLTGTGEITLTFTDAGQVAHICEEMAQEVVGPYIARLLEFGPLDDSVEPQIREAVESLSWAAATARDLYRTWRDDHEAEVAA